MRTGTWGTSFAVSQEGNVLIFVLNMLLITALVHTVALLVETHKNS